MRLKKEDYQNYVDMLVSGKLLILKKEVLIGTLYPKKVLRYPFYIDGVEQEVKTSQVKDRLLALAKRQGLIKHVG